MEEGLAIAEVAALTGLTAHTLRYYERAGLLLSPPRQWNGHRRYTELELSFIRILTKLRSTGMSIEDMRRYAELCRQGPGNEPERRTLLLEHRTKVMSRMRQLEDDLEHVDRKIALYSGTVVAP